MIARRALSGLLGAGVISLGLGLLHPGHALARPGGGGSFSGGGSSSSGSGGSSSGSGGSWSSSGSSGSGGSSKPAKPRYLTRASSGKTRQDDRIKWAPGAISVFGAPPRPASWPVKNELTGTWLATFLFVLGSVVLGGVGGLVYGLKRLARRRRGSGWSTAAQMHLHVQGVAPIRSRNDLEVIRETDPDFSVALFEDFLYALFAEAHVARGARQLSRLSPYLRPAVQEALASRSPHPVSTVIIGSMSFAGHARQGEHDRVVVELQANYAETPPGSPEHAYWVSERWTLARPIAAKSRPPERVRIFDCPGCGAPLDKLVGGVCGYCQRTVDSGGYDWMVESIQLVSIEPRGPMLTGTTVERGTDFPTVMDGALTTRHAALKAKDPAHDDGAFQARVGLVFSTMQYAWSSLEWERARPFLSDNLYHAQRYWIDAYRKSGLRNITERARILRMDLARVAQDRWFDSITVRVFATSLDYTLRDYDGAVVGGDRQNERVYSEYWTFIRSATASGRARTEAVCPQCAAPLEVNMAGDCKHCRAKVHSGQFDWVLARIEQDEVYTG